MKKRFGILGAALLAFTLTACGSGAAGQAKYIGLDAAKAVALEAAGLQEGEAAFSTTGLEKQNGIDFYAVDFTANGQSYEYDIDAVTGVVIDSDTRLPCPVRHSGGYPRRHPRRFSGGHPRHRRAVRRTDHRRSGQGRGPGTCGPHQRAGDGGKVQAGLGERPAGV